MNIDTILLAIENFRTTIENWGISNEALWVAGGIALVVFFFSLREVLSWFLKIQALAEDIRELRREIRELKSALPEAPGIVAPPDVVEPVTVVVATTTPAVEAEKAKAPVRRFPFDH